MRFDRMIVKDGRVVDADQGTMCPECGSKNTTESFSHRGYRKCQEKQCGMLYDPKMSPRRDPTDRRQGKDATNHLGERTFQTYNAWRAACKAINPNVQFEGDKDICQAKPGIGEWDGNEGCIYTKDAVEHVTKYRGFDIYQSDQTKKVIAVNSNQTKSLNADDIPGIKKEIDNFLTSAGTTDKENIYYSTIVAAAREINNPKMTKEDAKKRVEQAFKNISVNFNEEEFNKAFHEFRTANASRIVYRPS